MQDTVGERGSLSSLRQALADLVAVGLCVLIVVTTALPMVEGTVFGRVVRALFVGFVPGYALVAALFPRARSDAGADTTRSRARISDGRIGRLERFALSIAASCGLLALIAGGLFVVSATDGTTTVWALAALTIGFGAIATIRRLALPPSEQFGRTATEWTDALNPLRSPRHGGDLLSTAAVGFVILFVLSSAAYAMAPVQEDGYTELYLLQQGGGEPIAEEYPDELTTGEEGSLIVGIGNNEGATTTYTVVVQLQAVEGEGTGASVQSSTELDRFEVTLEGGETVETEHTITPEQAGEDLRLTYLLYVGDPPENPSEENAYRSTYIWVDVTDGG